MNKPQDLADSVLGIRVGMTTAAEIVRQHWGNRYAKCVLDYEREWAATIDMRARGCRPMVEGDILLPRPVMTAADIGWNP